MHYDKRRRHYLASLQTLDNTDTNFKRKLSKREKKEQKKKEKLQKLNPNADDSENHVAEKLYTGKSIDERENPLCTRLTICETHLF